MATGIGSYYMADGHRRRLAVSQEAKKLLSEKPIIFDTETTGIDHQAQIVEICVVSADKVVLLDTLVHPTMPIPAEASAVHGIRDVHVLFSPDWQEVYPRFVEAIYPEVFMKGVLTGYNLEFDTRLVHQSSAFAMGRTERLPVADSAADPACIMELYAVWNGDWHDYHQSYTWKSLDYALEDLGVEREGDAHRARSDTLGALGVLKAMAAYS